jgi:hypothetical protein
MQIENIKQTHLGLIHNDSPEPWGTFFQDNATPHGQELEELHNNIMFYLAIWLFAVSWMIISIVYKYANKYNKGLIKFINTLPLYLQPFIFILLILVIIFLVLIILVVIIFEQPLLLDGYSFEGNINIENRWGFNINNQNVLYMEDSNTGSSSKSGNADSASNSQNRYELRNTRQRAEQNSRYIMPAPVEPVHWEDWRVGSIIRRIPHIEVPFPRSNTDNASLPVQELANVQNNATLPIQESTATQVASASNSMVMIPELPVRPSLPMPEVLAQAQAQANVSPPRDPFWMQGSNTLDSVYSGLRPDELQIQHGPPGVHYTHTETMADGSSIHHYTGNRKIVYHRNGNIVEYLPNGVKLITYPNRSFSVIR